MRVFMTIVFLVPGLILTASYFLSRQPTEEELERFTFSDKVAVEALRTSSVLGDSNALSITLAADRNVNYDDASPHYETLRERLGPESPVTISVGQMHGPLASLVRTVVSRISPASTEDGLYEVSINGDAVLTYDETLDFKQNRAMLPLGAGVLSLLIAGTFFLTRKKR